MASKVFFTDSGRSTRLTPDIPGTVTWYTVQGNTLEHMINVRSQELDTSEPGNYKGVLGYDWLLEVR